MMRTISSLGLEKIGKKTQRHMRTASTSGALIMITMFSLHPTLTVSILWNSMSQFLLNLKQLLYLVPLPSNQFILLIAWYGHYCVYNMQRRLGKQKRNMDLVEEIECIHSKKSSSNAELASPAGMHTKQKHMGLIPCISTTAFKRG